MGGPGSILTGGITLCDWMENSFNFNLQALEIKKITILPKWRCFYL